MFSGTFFTGHGVEWCGYATVKKNLKICLFISTESTNVTDGRTDGETDKQTRQKLLGALGKGHAFPAHPLEQPQ